MNPYPWPCNRHQLAYLIAEHWPWYAAFRRKRNRKAIEKLNNCPVRKSAPAKYSSAAWDDITREGNARMAIRDVGYYGPLRRI